ncbi:MAG: DUF4360 domain-containing protein [Pseudobacteriovorax sp.]|nr:DUF4360 domain-containing protein [Pseudobacteriovorax sp.]
MKIRNQLVAFVVGNLGLSLAAFGQYAPDTEIEILDIVYNGSGCPLGTVAENVSPDKDAFTLTFSDYIAEAGPVFTARDGRKNCQLTLNLKVPSGWQYSIGDFDYRGFVYLDNGVRAEHQTNYYFQGDVNTTSFNEQIFGPADDSYAFRETIGLQSRVWSKCSTQRALNINTSINVRNMDKRRRPNAEGVIGTDSIDGQITQIYGVKWRRCDQQSTDGIGFEPSGLSWCESLPHSVNPYKYRVLADQSLEVKNATSNRTVALLRIKDYGFGNFNTLPNGQTVPTFFEYASGTGNELAVYRKNGLPHLYHQNNGTDIPLRCQPDALQYR